MPQETTCSGYVKALLSISAGLSFGVHAVSIEVHADEGLKGVSGSLLFKGPTVEFTNKNRPGNNNRENNFANR